MLARPQPRLGETRAVVIIHRGKLVSERYMPGYGPDTPLLSWSMAKSITHALVGIAGRRPFGGGRSGGGRSKVSFAMGNAGAWQVARIGNRSNDDASALQRGAE